MTALNRFLSASAAGWVRIILTIVTQLLLVPLFLGRWSVEEYGCWLVIQTIVSLSSLMSSSHQTYIGYELLKIGDKRLDDFRTLFYSAIPWALLIGLIELLVILSLIYLGLAGSAFDPDHALRKSLLQQAFWSLVIYSTYALITGSIGGLAGRAVAPFGYFPRMQWWGTYMAIAAALASAIAVAAGGNLIEVVACTVAAQLLINVPIHVDMWRMFRRHQLLPVAPDWKLGRRNVAHSVAIAVTAVLDIFRQQGVRLLLSVTIGVVQMTAFSTMRTMSNLSLQGIGTVTNPMMPEIMRFLREKDADRTNAIMGFVWLFAVIALAPLLIVFQWIMPVVFHYWTRGKIAFNPAVFGLFSISLLIFAVARPLLAVLQGNNLLKIQLHISIANSIVAVAGIMLFSRILGMAGAATSLLLAELLATILTTVYARRWLEQNGISFPRTLFHVTLSSIGVSALSILLMIGFPQTRTLELILSIVANIFIAIAYVRALPDLALNRVRGMIRR